MKLREYNGIRDEVEGMIAFAHALLDEAERKKKEALATARAYLKEKLGADICGSVSSMLTQVELQESGITTAVGRRPGKEPHTSDLV